jgi:hypothetical protein
MTCMAKKKADVKVGGAASMSMSGRSVSIAGNSLVVTNEYGNSVSYEIGAHSFDALWSQLWQFVKDSQH